MNSKGTILIMTLLIMTAVVAGIMVINEKTSKEYDFTQQLYTDTQSSFYFHSAIKIATRLLKEDDNKFDSSKDDWYFLPPFRVNNFTTVSMSITPTNAFIGINNLKSHNKNLSQRTKNALVSLLDESKFNTDEIIKKLEDKKEDFFSLKEMDFFLNLDEFSSFMHKYLTTNNGSGKININFASEDVINSYLPEISDCTEDIIKHREKNPFKNITQLRELGCISDDIYLKIQPYITTKSDTFVVKIEVIMYDIHRYATVILERSPGHVKIVKYFEGKGFYG